MNLNNLKNALEQVIFELNANGKHESANFFQTRYDQIINFGDKIPFEVVESLSTCRAMSQYANFSLREEKAIG
ncbi:hypothetical protein [Enterobacter cloacae complex sp. 330C8]|uniref:hypothetical protein n=1 Tax=Enterobacter cloacae complex sp. 330C8 TaxID=3395837 RepID=UPI003CE90B41